MLTLYRLLIAVVFYTFFPLMLIYVMITGNHREGIRQRLALYPRLREKSVDKRIWIHAASVGEVQAAATLLEELQKLLPGASYVISTMTVQGRDFAQGLFPDFDCILAPLDIPGIAARAVHKIDPDLYICLETELWPVLLGDLGKGDIPLVLVNGRMSRKTEATYKKYSSFFGKVLANFNHLCLISETDKERFLASGVEISRIGVYGNIKYDRKLPQNSESVIDAYKRKLSVTDATEVFIVGSTHDDEEEQILSRFRKFGAEEPFLWIVAPRHLNRIDDIGELLNKRAIPYQLFSSLESGDKREASVILVDTFGDLLNLYSTATYVFCGGSLVDRRGHNIMEPALWGKPVFYGPSMDDFQDGVDLLEPTGGGMEICSADELFLRIRDLREKPEVYKKICAAAYSTAVSQQGAAKRQAGIALSYL